MNIGSKKRAAVVGIALVAASLLSAAEGLAARETKPGAAQEKEPFSYIPADVRAKMLAQRPYSAAADRVQEAVDASGVDGLAGIAVREDHVELWWKGAVPAGVAAAAENAGVPVEVHAAAYSRNELKKAAEPLMAAMEADPKSGIHMVQIPVDGRGLIAGVDRADAGPITSGSSVPVEVVEQERIPFAAGPPTRYNDGWAGSNPAAFSGGGALINNDNYLRCTAGWGVTDGTGAEWLLTAGHCGRVGGGWSNGNLSRIVGTARVEHVSHDLLLIPTDADNYMWDGGASTNNFLKRVTGWAEARPGELVCQSGSTSGAVCNIRNTDQFMAKTCGADIYGNQECYYDLVLAEHVNGETAARGGDSGGPVFSLAGVGLVTAKGTVTGGKDGSKYMTYQDFYTAAVDYGIRPIT